MTSKKNQFIHSPTKEALETLKFRGGKSSKMSPPEKKCTKTKGNHEEGLNLTLWVGHDCISCITVSSSLTTAHTVLHHIPTSSDVEISICTSWTCNNGNGHAVFCTDWESVFGNQSLCLVQSTPLKTNGHVCYLFDFWGVHPLINT